jgi:hypothetical protein
LNGAANAALIDTALERLEAIPGVRSAALSSTALLTGDNSQGRFGVEGQPEPVISYVLSIHNDFFQTVDLQCDTCFRTEWSFRVRPGH